MRLNIPDVKMVLQPDQTGLCGQASVAMAAGVSLDEAFIAVGVTGLRGPGTLEEDIARGLRKLGMKVGETRIWKRNTPDSKVPRFPKCAVVSVDDNRTRWGHWVYIKDGWVFDPGLGWPMPLRVYEDVVIERAYSRRFKRARDGHKQVKARWWSIVPIYGRKK